MEYRTLGRTGFNVSAVSFGAWAIGGSWGNVDDKAKIQAIYEQYAKPLVHQYW